MNIRRFNSAGLEHFGRLLNDLRQTPSLAVPREWLEDDTLTDRLGTDIAVDDRHFPRRFEAAAYLYERIHGRVHEPERDAGLWAWLTLFYFDQVCPPRSSGRRIASTDSYIPLVANKRRYYRHLLLGPFTVFAAYVDWPSSAEFVLHSPLKVATDEVYRLLVEGPLIHFAPVVETATTLYWDRTRRERRWGQGAKTSGGMRRFVRVSQQLDRTFDFGVISTQGLLSMLPREFDRFREEVNHGPGKVVVRTRTRARS